MTVSSDVGMDLEDDVRRLEDALPDQADLAAAPLLRRRREDLDRADEVRAEDGLQDDGRVGAGRADDVVAAGMSQAGQGVHLGRECHPRPAGAGIVNGPKGRGQGFRRGADVEPFVLEQGPEQAGGAHFLEGQLGIGVDAPAQIENPAAALLDGLGDPVIHIHRVPASIIIQKENPCQKRGPGIT